ncbi:MULTISPECIES: PDZ domain-containing protein [unclassified Paenibacillus]|uniref:PDZ domain-containing protein n=1 Tax=unclassified Paenibacillus TaxID=185978 RepID=UPI001C11CCD0|nr:MULTISPECIES: PDZ domain-containing protein [unclassified Paenibacillus]MBU5442264.1 PDZ domain-containing protein [Paenibacillus sp. MSJ-34]CAH0121823.1 Cell division topological determinant MinJ [Paenibacillus sp. CECT 9249]
MEFALETLQNIAEAIVRMLMQPFFYIAILFVFLQYRRQVTMERKLFHVRMHAWSSQIWRTLLGGIAAGIAVSIAFVFLGISLSPAGMICIWAVALVLLLFRVRYLCLAYSIGILGIIRFILGFFPALESGVPAWLGVVVQTVRELDIPALLALVALLHLAEALLVRYQGARFAGPLFFAGKRGKLIGGYQMQGLWPVPLFMTIPAQTAGTVLPWTPFFGGDAWLGGWAMIAFPVVIGFSEMTQSRLPQEKARVSSSRLLAYGAVVLALAVGAELWSPLAIVAAVAALALHEGLTWYSGKEEAARSPLFVHDSRGLRILAVLPSGPAKDMGIRAGETIHKVNGVRVRTKEELHQALRMNSAFCKLEVLDLAGESKFLQRAIYAGDHHQLGVVLAPDQDAAYYAETRQVSLLGMIKVKIGGLAAGSGRKRQDETETLQ